MYGKKIRLFNLYGFEVGIDPSWVFIAILIAWSLSTGLFPIHYRNLSTATYWTMGVIGAAGLFLSIILHEFAHSIVARRYGIPMKGITLFIFGGVAEMSSEPPNARSELLMAIAGPIASVIIGLFFLGLLSLGRVLGWPGPVAGVLGYLAFINGILAAFNLLPAFPLDGGRVLRAILWTIKKDIRRATRISSAVGSMFGVFFIVFGVLNFLRGSFIGGMWWFLIGMFLRNAARVSYQQLMTRRFLEGEPVSRFMKKEPVTVPPDLAVDRFVEDYVYEHHFSLFPVVDAFGRLVGCVTPKDVKQLPREVWAARQVGEIAAACGPENTVDSREDAVAALARMNRGAVTRLMVVENGRLAGIVTLKDLLSFLALKVELEN